MQTLNVVCFIYFVAFITMLAVKVHSKYDDSWRQFLWAGLVICGAGDGWTSDMLSSSFQCAESPEAIH